MVKLMGAKQVQPYSAKLIEAVLPHLRHRHSAVRVAVLQALEHALLAGAGSSVETLVGWRLQNNVYIYIYKHTHIHIHIHIYIYMGFTQALIWYRALTGYSSPARSLAAPDDPRLVTGQ